MAEHQDVGDETFRQGALRQAVKKWRQTVDTNLKTTEFKQASGEFARFFMCRRALAQLWNRVGKAKNRLIQLDRAEDFRADVALSQLRLYFSRWLSALEEYPSMYRKSRQFELQSAVRHWNQISVAASKRHKLARWRADVCRQFQTRSFFRAWLQLWGERNQGNWSKIRAVRERAALNMQALLFRTWSAFTWIQKRSKSFPVEKTLRRYVREWRDKVLDGMEVAAQKSHSESVGRINVVSRALVTWFDETQRRKEERAKEQQRVMLTRSTLNQLREHMYFQRWLSVSKLARKGRIKSKLLAREYRVASLHDAVSHWLQWASESALLRRKARQMQEEREFQIMSQLWTPWRELSRLLSHGRQNNVKALLHWARSLEIRCFSRWLLLFSRCKKPYRVRKVVLPPAPVPVPVGVYRLPVAPRKRLEPRVPLSLLCVGEVKDMTAWHRKAYVETKVLNPSVRDRKGRLQPRIPAELLASKSSLK